MRKKNRLIESNPVEERLRRERIAIYSDCICGAFSAILSISCIIFFSITEGIPYPDRFSLGLTFWIIWLLFSFSIMGVGIYQSKHLDEKKPRKNLKAPRVYNPLEDFVDKAS